MLKIGDKVVYSSYGVMEIVDIRDELVMNNSQRYYILEALGSHSGSLTFIPVDNEKLVSKLRPLLTKEEALRIIHSIDTIPEAEWIQDNRARSERFKNVIESGDHEKMIAMIKLVNKTGKRREEEGKKNYLADQNAMQKAEKLLYSEFATVFGIDEAMIPEFIENEKINN